jgi:hypothetical protein
VERERRRGSAHDHDGEHGYVHGHDRRQQQRRDVQGAVLLRQRRLEALPSRMRTLIRFRSRTAGFTLLVAAAATSTTTTTTRRASATPASDARDVAAACMQSADRAQVLRRSGKLSAARAALSACAAETCPAVVRDDCRTWTAEVQAAQPTVVFSVRGSNGSDLVDAKVSIDGARFLERIDGLARPLDPGPHTIDVEAATETPVRLRVVVHEGEKQRVLPIVFRSRGPVTAPPAPAAITPWVYVTGSLALAGLAGFAVLGLTAISDHAALRDGCATTRSCTDDQVASNKARFWMADASLLVGLVSAGITGYLLYDHARRSPDRAAPAGPRAGDVRVSGGLRGGPFLQVDALF